MIFLDQIHPVHQTVLLTTMFLTTLLSLLCLRLSRYGKRSILYLAANVTIFLLLFFLIGLSIETVKTTSPDLIPAYRIPIPVWGLWYITLCAAALLVGETVVGLRHLKRTVSRRSVKDAMDTLPGAICFFHPSGTVKLCNLQMYRLFRSMTQSDLQTLSELQEALAKCDGINGIVRLSEEKQTYQFPDGKVWQYHQTEVTAKDGITYTEALFSDVTELYEKHQELNRHNAELKAMYRDIKQLSDNVLEMTRESEILHAKTNLHDQMGAGIVAIRQSLQQHCTSEKNAEAIALLFNAVKVIKNDNDSPVGRSDIEEFIHNASVVGVRVEMTGSLPEEEIRRNLCLLAMKECCTNAVRHAGAQILFVTAEESDGVISLHIENDGSPPKGTVTPKGGLLNLRRQLEKYGGKMQIRSAPRFALTVTIPSNDPEQKERIT